MKKIVFLLFSVVCFLFSKDELKILNWPEYIDVQIIKEFTAKTDIPIKYDIYKNNDQLIHKLESKDSYDIVFPSSSFLKVMIEKGLISPIDKSRLKNYGQIDSFFLNSDELKKYAIPYTWGTTGILINKSKKNIKSFSELWNKEFEDKLFILDDMSDMFAIAFSVLGLDINTQNELHIKKAFEKLVELIPNIKGVYEDSEKLYLEFVNENIYAAVIYNGDVEKIIKNKKFHYIYPKEGALLWIDTIAVDSNSKNLDSAYSFIDFIISKEKAFQNFKEVGYATPHKDVRFNEELYPNEKDRKNLKRVVIGENINIYDKYWNMFLDKLSKKGVFDE